MQTLSKQKCLELASRCLERAESALNEYAEQAYLKKAAIFEKMAFDGRD